MSKVRESAQIVHRAIEDYNPSHVFALFSGGHDSLCAAHVASQHPRFDGCLHIDTGIGIEETRQFVRDTCRHFRWPLKEYRPKDSYETLVLERGFPGPAMHWKMYHRLKERCLRQAIRDFRDDGNRRRKIVFISGRRKAESQRRMVNMSEAVVTGEKNPSPRIVWANPLIHWEASDKERYITAHNLPRNPVVSHLCMSGECLCGAFARSGELDLIRLFYPMAAQEIDRIANLARERGVHCNWGVRPDRFRSEDSNIQPELPLCWSCEEKHERQLETANVLTNPADTRDF